MEPNVLNLIPENKPYGMDDVIKQAMANKKLVSSFITKKGFTDIGNKESYEKAYQEHIQKLENN
jgi:mannose-1-phosphate guanylyltransferase